MFTVLPFKKKEARGGVWGGALILSNSFFIFAQEDSLGQSPLNFNLTFYPHPTYKAKSLFWQIQIFAAEPTM